MIDTAAGSCGFPVHTFFQTYRFRPFTNAERSARMNKSMCLIRYLGSTYDEKTVRIARTLNLIAGDGETNVLHLNTLDYERWNDRVGKRIADLEPDLRQMVLID